MINEQNTETIFAMSFHCSIKWSTFQHKGAYPNIVLFESNYVIRRAFLGIRLLGENAAE